MIREIIKQENFIWKDVTAPSLSELESLANLHNLHPVSVQDCLEPDHMPKLERFSFADFMILRSYDETASGDADTVRDLTRKVAIFISSEFVITIHRAAQPYVDTVIRNWISREATTKSSHQDSILIVQELLRMAILTYEKPLLAANERLENLEESLFKADHTPIRMLEGYYLHRKGNIFKHMLKLSSDVVDEFKVSMAVESPYFRDIHDHANRLLFYATELEANSSHLLNLSLSIASQRLNISSHRSNEIMRVLTVFSAFFLPLNFIGTVYGMNFYNLPGIQHPDGYLTILGIMTVVAGFVAYWFGRKGWLRREKISKELF